MDSGSDDDISVPGLTEDEDHQKQKKVKLLKTSKQRDEQRSKSRPPRTRIKEADTIALNSVPNAPGFKAWWNNLCTIMSTSSSYPDRAFTWARTVKRDSDYKLFNDSEGFDSLDIKFAVALTKILPNNLKRKIALMEEKWTDHHGTQFKGRQILVLLLRWFQESEKDADFLNIVLHARVGSVHAWMRYACLHDRVCVCVCVHTCACMPFRIFSLWR